MPLHGANEPPSPHSPRPARHWHLDLFAPGADKRQRDSSSPPSLAISRTVHQRCAGWDPHPQEAYLGFLEGLFARLNRILSVTIRPAALILALWAASALADIFPQPPRRDVTIAA